MGAQVLVDKFDGLTPKKKFIWVGILLLVCLGALLTAYIFGRIHGRAASDDQYLADRDANLAKVAVAESSAAQHIKNEQQLAAENALLKKQNEATAEILKQSDAKLNGDAANLTKLLDERNKKYDEIDADTDFDNQLCGMCADFAKSGFRLSDATCGRCKATAKAGSGP